VEKYYYNPLTMVAEEESVSPMIKTSNFFYFLSCYLASSPLW